MTDSRPPVASGPEISATREPPLQTLLLLVRHPELRLIEATLDGEPLDVDVATISLYPNRRGNVNLQMEDPPIFGKVMVVVKMEGDA